MHEKKCKWILLLIMLIFLSFCATVYERGVFMFAAYFRTDEIVFKHAKGCRDVFGKEFHIFHELFFLVGNTAKFASDHLVEEIHTNTLVIIPKHQFHQFDHIGQEADYHRYVLQFDKVNGLDAIISQVFDCVKLISNVQPQTLMLFEKLARLTGDHKSGADKEILLKAIFAELLIDLKYNYSNAAITSHITDPTVPGIIDYIGKNFLGNISIGSIAKSLNYSETYISHKFRKIMGIPIHQYILQKKLIHAHRLICSGIPATEAATICAFKEYSGFYKMYKKYFGFSPSKTPRK